jgi:hypothetical protein
VARRKDERIGKRKKIKVEKFFSREKRKLVGDY